MTKLIETLLFALESRFDGKFSEDSLGHSTSIRTFVRSVRFYYIVLRNLKAVHGPNIKVALIADNMYEFIACYIALIISNVDFYLIPVNLRPVLLDSIVSGNDINFIFTNTRLEEINSFKRLPFFKGIFDILENKFMYLKSDKPKITYDEINQMMAEAANQHESKGALKALVYDEFMKRDREMTVYSSGVSSTYVNAITFTDDDVFRALDKLTDADTLPELYGSKFNSTNLTYSYAPVWAILWPIVNGAIFSTNHHDAEVIVTSSENFEDEWKFVTEDLYEKRFIGKLLTKNWLYWLFKFLAKRRLDTYFNSNVKKKAIIIINAFMPPRINDTIVNLPIYTTYGMQEMNQVVAVNDRSTPMRRKENCVGKLLDGIAGDIRDNSLILSSDLVSDCISLQKGVWFDTRDQGTFRGGLLFIYGKMKYRINDNLYTSDENRENLERIMRNIPYFSDVLCFQDMDNNNHLLIYPNPKVIETMRYGMFDFMNLIKPYMTIINERYGSGFLSSINLVFNDFIRTHTGKIHKEIYFIASRKDRHDIGF